MKRVILAAACVVLMDGAAGAQQYTQWPGSITFGGGSSGRLAIATLTHTKTGDVALDRAMAICDAHPNSSWPPSQSWPTWDPEYAKPCAAVYRAWNKSEVANKAAKLADEKERREADDKAFLDGFADGLGR